MLTSDSTDKPDFRASNPDPQKTAFFKLPGLLLVFLPVLAMMLFPSVANAVHFAAAYELSIDGQKKLLMKRKVKPDNSIELNIQPTQHHGDKKVQEEWQKLLEQVHGSGNLLFPDLYAALVLQPVVWHQNTEQPAELTITIDESSENMPCTHYSLGGTQIANIVSSDAAPEHVQGFFSGEDTTTWTTSANGEITSHPGPQSPLAHTAGDEVEDEDEGMDLSTGEKPATVAEFTCSVIAAEHGHTGTLTHLAMFGTQLESQFDNLISSESEPESAPFLSLLDPLEFITVGGDMLPSSIPHFFRLMSMRHAPTPAVIGGFRLNQELTYDPETHTITQQDPADDPHPSGVVITYHINQDVIDSIQITYQNPNGASPPTIITFSAWHEQPLTPVAAPTAGTMAMMMVGLALRE